MTPTTVRLALAASMAAFLGCSGSPSPAPGNHASSSGGGSAIDASAGYYVEPADGLPAPAAGTGIHLETPDYDATDPNAKQLVVQPGQEIFLCYYVTLPNKAEVDVGAFQSLMSSGSSHHFILYQQGTGPFTLTARRSRAGRSRPASSGRGRGSMPRRRRGPWWG